MARLGGSSRDSTTTPCISGCGYTNSIDGRREWLRACRACVIFVDVVQVEKRATLMGNRLGNTLLRTTKGVQLG